MGRQSINGRCLVASAYLWAVCNGADSSGLQAVLWAAAACCSCCCFSLVVVGLVDDRSVALLGVLWSSWLSMMDSFFFMSFPSLLFSLSSSSCPPSPSPKNGSLLLLQMQSSPAFAAFAPISPPVTPEEVLGMPGCPGSTTPIRCSARLPPVAPCF